MKVKSIAKNQTEVTFHDGTKVFYSYETPVAAYHALSVEEDAYGEGGNWLRLRLGRRSGVSASTTQHITNWLEDHLFLDDPASVVPIAVDQAVIENLVKEKTLPGSDSTRAMYRTEFE